MAKLVPMNGFLLLSRRAYTAAEKVREQSAASVTRKVSEGSKEVGGVEKAEVFWMRDPKTGYWIPETHVEEMDAADLRLKFLSKKGKL